MALKPETDLQAFLKPNQIDLTKLLEEQNVKNLQLTVPKKLRC